MADNKYMWNLRTNTLHRRHQPEGDKDHGLKRSTKGAMTHAKISATTLPIVLRHHNATRPQPTLRSILHPFNGTTRRSPISVHSKLAPLITSVCETSMG